MTNPTGLLHLMLQHDKTTKKIEEILKASLPNPLKQHCYVANWRDKTLVIRTDSSLWATKLRYKTPELLRCWHNNSAMPTIEQILIRVRVPKTGTHVTANGCR